MTISEHGLKFIAKHEGLRLKPYLDAAGRPTIGYGNTYYETFRPVQMTDPPITKERALELFRNIVEKYASKVDAIVKSKINQNQFDALVSIAYNIGIGRFVKSTLLGKVNTDPGDSTIRKWFEVYNKVRIKGQLEESLGLTRRRKAEADLYFTPSDQ